MAQQKKGNAHKKNTKKGYIIPLLVILVFSAVLFTAYRLLSNQMAAQTVSQRLGEHVSQKGTMMEDYLQPEIALAKKLATSPVVKEFFVQPSNAEKRARAMAEFTSFREAFSSHIIFWANDVDKEYWSDMHFTSIVNPDNPADYWYKMTLYETDVYNFNINYNADMDMTALWLNAVVRGENMKPIGMSGTGIALDSFIEKCYEDLDESERMFFFNEKKEITGAREKRYITDKTKIDTMYGESISIDFLMEKAKAAAENKSEGQYTVTLGTDTKGVIRYLPSYDWFLIATAPVSSGRGASTRALLYMLLAVLAIVVVLVLMMARVQSALAQVKRSQEKEHALGSKLFEETQNLAVATKETAATSQDSNAAVKEIVATMEDSNSLSENISAKIRDVASVANKTSGDVSAGVAAIEKNVRHLRDIFTTNQQMISGIKDLGEKIESIWDIVTLINSIADQAKIIAFNTELEVAGAGAAGESFRIVAGEIRRLSDGIIDGTKEIKEKITEIQKSSDSLILASESGTEKINAGYESAKELETQFASIQSSSEITATSAQDIRDIVQQQATASEQILIALKQISGGVENFSAATENISKSAENLRGISEDLNNQMKE